MRFSLQHTVRTQRHGPLHPLSKRRTSGCCWRPMRRRSSNAACEPHRRYTQAHDRSSPILGNPLDRADGRRPSPGRTSSVDKPFRLLHEFRTDRGSSLRVLKKIDCRRGERLRRVRHALVADRHGRGRDDGPRVPRRLECSGDHGEVNGRNDPTDVADVGRSAFRRQPGGPAAGRVRRDPSRAAPVARWIARAKSCSAVVWLIGPSATRLSCSSLAPA